jgi:hypothetical protein
VKGKVFFLIFKNIQINEFKHEFEFKHSKTMHQHVCNSKLLYFIILINKKMIKCLEKHKHLIFLKRER